MAAISRVGRLVERASLAVRGWIRVENVPTETFNEILKAHLARGWVKTYEYEGFDAWIDYGRADVQSGQETLRFEWTNWLEGEISGSRSAVERLSAAYKLPLENKPEQR